MTEDIETPNNTDDSKSGIWPFIGGALVTLTGVTCVKAYGKMRDWKTGRKLARLAESQKTDQA